MKTEKSTKTIRLTEEVVEEMRYVQKKLGLSQSEVVCFAVDFFYNLSRVADLEKLMLAAGALQKLGEGVELPNGMKYLPIEGERANGDGSRSKRR